MNHPVRLGPGAMLVAAAAGLLAVSHSQAQMIKCQDAKGKVYYGTTMPKECLGKPSEELSKSGQTVVRRNEGALTPEQIEARDAERKKQAEAEARAQEEKRKNTALLNTYASEKDIDEARSRALKENELAIKETQKRVADGEKRHKELDGEREFYKKGGMPPKLQQDIRNNEVELANQKELLQAKVKQVALINAKYDEDKRRYQELTRGQAAARR